MTTTSLVIRAVVSLGYVTGTRSWMMFRTKEYKLVADSAFWLTLANVCLVGYVSSRIILGTSKHPILMVLMQVLFSFVTVVSSAANLLTRRERRRAEVDCSPLLKEFGAVSRPLLLFIPFSLGTILVNVIAFPKDMTTSLAILFFWPVIINESSIILTVLAISERFYKISKSIEQLNPANANRVLTAAMDHHYEHYKLVKRLNAAYVVDYFMFSLVCLVRIIYLVIDIIQDIRNQTSIIFTNDTLSTVLFVCTITGRYLLTSWAGTRLINASEDSLEAMLNVKFYQKSRLQAKSNILVDMFINQLRERKVSLSVFDMFDLGLGTFTSFIETTVTYVIVVVNTLGAKKSEEAKEAAEPQKDSSALSTWLNFFNDRGGK